MTYHGKQRLIAAVTLLGIIAVVVLLSVPYLKKMQAYQNLIDERQSKIASLKQQIANKPLLQQEIKRLSALLDQSSIFIRAADPQAANTKLLSLTKKIIEDAGGEIHSVVPINKNDKHKTHVRIKAIVDYDAMIAIFKNMAVSKPLINISNISITALLKKQKKQWVDSGKVEISLDLEAFLIRDQSS